MHGSPSAQPSANPAPGATRTGHDVSPPDKWSRRAAIGVLFAPMPWIMRLFAFVHFSGIRVMHAERFPRAGPAIMVANHPATWVDVLVLHVALGRKLHFLAADSLYEPRVRAWLLEIFGALPVAAMGTRSEREALNEPTFRWCRRLLGRGEVVAIFPEGVSATDRSLRRFRTGAARIAATSRELGRHVPILPVGLHYIDRVAFRSRVVVNIGEPVRLPLERGNDPRERAEWVAHATAELERAVAELILDLPEPEVRATLEELAPLLAGRTRDEAALLEAKRLAGRMVALAREQPGEYRAIARHAARHRRMRVALGLAPHEVTTRGRLAGLTMLTVLGAVPALAGLVVHALPAYITQRVARRFDPTRVTLMRIGVGWVSFSAWYLLLAAAGALVLRSAWGLLAPFAAAALGALALEWSDAWRELEARLRWSVAARRAPHQMSRLLCEEAILVRQVATAASPAPTPSETRQREELVR